MIQNLLTALGVAALSIQTPNNNTHEEPKRAYYDSSAVAEYETTLNKCFNYSSHTLNSNGTTTNTEEITYWDSHAYPIYVDPENTYTTSTEATEAIPEVTSLIDIYIDGVLSNDAVSWSSYPGQYYRVVFQYNTQGHYIWVFDHQEPSMSQTIIETAGDATTAAAAVVGAGFTGVISLFYNEGITGLGILSLILVGVSLVWFAFALVIRLWRRD